VLQCVAVCIQCGLSMCWCIECGLLQCVAVCCSVLQCVAVGCSVLQCVYSVVYLCVYSVFCKIKTYIQLVGVYSRSIQILLSVPVFVMFLVRVVVSKFARVWASSRRVGRG